jgi:hypothetical protein
MADNQGTYRIQIQVVGDDVAAKLSGVNKEFEQLSKVVDKANAKLRDHNKAHKGTANFYDQQIKLLKDLRDRLARTTGETNKYNVAIENLTKKKAALSAPMKGTLAAFKLELQELRLQQAQVAKTSAQWDAYEKKIASVRSKVDALTGSQRIQTKTNKDMISNAGLGGAVLTELGRTVSDANYGFTAMANNLSQLSTLFITLTAKTEGGFKQTIKDLGKQIMGPLGIVLALQLAITLFEKFAISQKSAASAAKSVTDEIYAQNVALGVIVDKIESTNTSEEERIRLTKVLIDEVPNLTKQDFAYGKNLDLVREKILKYTLAQAARAEMDKLVADNSEILAKRSAIDRIKALDDETQAQEKLGKIREFLISQGQVLSGVTGARTLGGATQRFELTADQIQKRFEKLSLSIERETDPILKKIYELAEGLDTFGGAGGKKAKKKVEDYLKMLNELYEEIFVKDENRFDAQIKQIQLELEKRLQSYDEVLKKEKLTETERASFLRARINAEQLASEKIQDIEEARAKFIRESAQKILDDQKKANDKQLADALKSTDDQATKFKAAKYKEAESIINDKERLAEKLKQIDIETLEFQINLIKKGIEDGTLARDEALNKIANLQVRLSKLTGKAVKESEDQMEQLKRSAKDFLDATINLIQLELDAELSKEERKTTIQNNALKERLRNENLSANQREAINKRIENNEIALQKKRDELAEKQFKLQKAIAIGQTIITSFEMATRAYNAVLAGPEKFLGISALALAKVAYGTALALGLAQVNAIRRQQFVPSGISAGSNGGTGGGATIAPPEFNIVGQSASNQVAQAVQGQFDKPVKAYVVSKDVSTAQEMDRNIVSTASL